MNRRSFFKSAAAFGIASTIPAWTMIDNSAPATASNARITPPENGVPVAFLLSEGAVVIDFAGPWEVFQDAYAPGDMANMKMDMFQLYTVAETPKTIKASAGLKIVPDYTFQNAPPPKVIVIPAQSAQQNPSPALQEWLRKSAKQADITMSVCTGAFVLANTGLLSGKAATTHHSSYKQMAMNYPDIAVKRGARFVDNGSIATSGGLSSGIDLALHVVERYYGTDVAKATAYQMEYQGTGWTDPNSNQIYAVKRVSTEEHPLCAVCDMDVSAATSPKSVYKGKNYYFCSEGHKQQFDRTPEKYIDAS
ncbi:MAG: DJ-1/PfpI family protein [Acidobacteria bacterium]|nr:DJ-1/PfpI family protein [Acidobacteriota bacterium]MBV9434757.1 DJ-1/PfpI family protein [Acidobacteriota bacterium]